MGVKISEIVQATGARTVGALNEDLPIHKISTDTRTLEKNDAFFALSGPRFDGHDFIQECLDKGASHLIVSDPQKVKIAELKNINVLLVPDTLKAYGDLAAVVRKKFKVPAVAVTGSSGKTTVKELLAHTASSRFRVLKNRGTENNLVGVPKTLLQLDPSHELLVLEMGTNRPGEIDRLSSMISPQMGIITQIGHAHLEGLGTLEGVCQEKLRLMHHLERGGILILNGSSPELKAVSSGVHRVLRVGIAADGNDFTANCIRWNENGGSFYLNDKEFFETRLIGAHNILNCLLVIAACVSLGMELSEIKNGIASFKPVPGRMNLKTVDGIHFIDDTYNANPLSFRAALEALKDLPVKGKKGVVCGDMLELGKESERLHREIGLLFAGLSFDFLIATGRFSRWLADESTRRGFDAQKIFLAKDSSDAGALCHRVASAGDWVLVKGSRGNQMEKVFECFTTSSIP